MVFEGSRPLTSLFGHRLNRFLTDGFMQVTHPESLASETGKHGHIKTWTPPTKNVT